MGNSNLKTMTPTLSPNDLRDYRFFWTSKSRDTAKQFSRGERKVRTRFAELVEAGKFSLAQCVAEAIELSRPKPEAWTEEAWKKHWTRDRLRAIGERWMLHPLVQERIKLVRKLREAKRELQEGRPAEIYADIANDPTVPARDRVAAAKCWETSLQRKPGSLVDMTDALKARARERAAEHQASTPPVEPRGVDEDVDS